MILKYKFGSPTTNDRIKREVALSFIYKYLLIILVKTSARSLFIPMDFFNQKFHGRHLLQSHKFYFLRFQNSWTSFKFWKMHGILLILVFCYHVL